MNQEELDALLRQNTSTVPARPERDLVSAVLGRLGRRERWQDVCLVLGGASVIAFCLALAVAAKNGPETGAPPALRLFQAQPASHPFGTP